MFSYLEERTPAEVEAIRRTIQELLRQTCILQVKYDPVTLTARDNGRYQVCLKHREFIADYLSVMGCELVHDPQDHLFRITGDGAAMEKMSLTTTKLLLLLKLIYRDKIMGETACNGDDPGGNPGIRQKYRTASGKIERTGLAGCAKSDENPPDDRAAGGDFERGGSDADLYLRYGEYFLLVLGNQRAGTALSG